MPSGAREVTLSHAPTALGRKCAGIPTTQEAEAWGGREVTQGHRGVTDSQGTYLLRRAGTQYPYELTTCLTDMVLEACLPSGHASGDPEVGRVGMTS